MIAEADCDLVFVYGTLRRDSGNGASSVLKQNASYAGQGFVRGRLFNLGSYPGLVIAEAPDETVIGELYKIARGRRKAVLDRLDEYEGCSTADPQPHEYRRELAEVFTSVGNLVTAWTYVLNLSTDGLDPMDSGDYLAWRAMRREASSSTVGDTKAKELPKAGPSMRRVS